MLLPQAVEQMKGVVATAQKEDADEQKEFIVNMISGFLMLMPFLSEEAAPALRLTLLGVGEAGNLGITIY